VVVGSALVKQVEREPERAAAAVLELAAPLIAATKGA
jgi:tryptophan synthase alpha subunit